MARELLLLRHGKSNHALGLPDFERPLKGRGERQARQIGAWLRSRDLRPDLTVSSPAVRALRTAQIALKTAGLEPGEIRADSRLYTADPAEVLEVLASVPERFQRVMLVGHNPWLDELFEALCRDPAPEGEGVWVIKTNTLVRLEMPEDWSALPAGCARLLDFVLPKTLPA